MARSTRDQSTCWRTPLSRAAALRVCATVGFSPLRARDPGGCSAAFPSLAVQAPSSSRATARADVTIAGLEVSVRCRPVADSSDRSDFHGCLLMAPSPGMDGSSESSSQSTSACPTDPALRADRRDVQRCADGRQRNTPRFRYCFARHSTHAVRLAGMVRTILR
jgi:hypothetical protein